MPSLRFNTSMAIGTTVLNVLTGSKFEYLPVNAAVIVYGTADRGLIASEITFGNVIEADQLEYPILIGAGPNVNDHRLAAGIAHAGDRLAIRLQNNNVAGGPDAVRTLIEIRPL